MPADYSSTARALASPVLPIPSSPGEQDGSIRPSFTRIQSTSSRRRNLAPNSSDGPSYKERIFAGAEMIHRKVLSTYKAMTPLQRIIAFVAVIVLGVLTLLAMIFSHSIFNWLGPAAKKWHDLPGGWSILWAAIFITAFPPVIGYSTCVTVAGFVYGMNGWFIVSTAATVGSLASFIASRTVLSKYVHNLVGNDKRFNAFAAVLKHDGLKILVMIRLCPLPYSISNGALSTFHTISPLMFTVATALSTPKLLIHVFIGSRLASLAESGGKMDKTTLIINYVSIAGGIILGAVTGYLIYSRTVARAAQLELEENQVLTDTPGFRRERDDYFEGDDQESGVTDPARAFEDDDISLWDNDDDAYRDDSEADEGTKSKKSKRLDEEAAIGGGGSGGMKDPSLF